MKSLKIPGGPEIPADELSTETFRSGGPGGQHANTSDTAVRLRFNLAGSRALSPGVKRRIRDDMPSAVTDDGELLLVSSAQRSQKQNLDDVCQRLVSIVQRNLRPPKRRRATRPTLGSKRRRLDAKKQRGEKKSMRGKVKRWD